MRVLITRPEPDAAAFAAAVKERGWTPVLAPMMEIRFETAAPPDLKGVGALAFTSANGVRAFTRLSGERALPAFAVGSATAAEASDAGFQNVTTAGGDVESLSAAIADVRPDGDVLHVCGRALAGDLVADLATRGVRARKAILYDAAAVSRLPEAARTALESTPPLEWATFFSPRTARLFIALCETAGCAARLADVRAGAASPAVADALSGAKWREVRVAEAASAPALIDAIAI